MSSYRPNPQTPPTRTAILKQEISRLATEIGFIQANISDLKITCKKEGQASETIGKCAVEINKLNHQVLPMIRQHQLFLDELTRIQREAADKKGGKPKTQNRKRNKSSIRQSRKVRRRRTSRTR